MIVVSLTISNIQNALVLLLPQNPKRLSSPRAGWIGIRDTTSFNFCQGVFPFKDECGRFLL
jgi:hypothetical protein